MPTGQPDLYLVGYGLADSLQITVESQRVLTRVGKAYALGLPPNLARYLRALGVSCVDLSDRLGIGRPWADAYLEIADGLLRRIEDDPPLVLLSPGNPMLSNAVGRFVLMKARERGLGIQVLPAVSPIDVAVCVTGLDVGTFGLQVFDARRVVSRGQALDPGVPLLLLQLAGVGAATTGASGQPEPTAYRSLVQHLGRFYPKTHPVTHLTDGSGGSPTATTVQLDRFEDVVTHVEAGSTLFVDRVRKRAGGPAVGQ